LLVPVAACLLALPGVAAFGDDALIPAALNQPPGVG